MGAGDHHARAPLPGARPVQEAAPTPAVEGRRARQVSGLRHLGDVREDPGHAARQPCGVRPQQDPRGIPRPGAALLHGLVYCGECGHKMVVQCRHPLHLQYLRQQHGVPLRISPPIRSTPGVRPRSSKPWHLPSWRPGNRPDGAAPGRRRHDPRRSPADRAAAAITPASPSVSSTASIPPTGWSRPSWSAVGKAALRELRDAEDGFARRQAERSRPDAISLTCVPPSWRRAIGCRLCGRTRRARQRAPQRYAGLIDKVAHRCAPTASRCASSGAAGRPARRSRFQSVICAVYRAPPRWRPASWRWPAMPCRTPDRRHPDGRRAPLADARPSAAQHGKRHPPAPQAHAEAQPVPPAEQPVT